MKVFTISKGPGKPPRIIYAPSRDERAALRALLPQLETIQARACKPRIVQGFSRGRSPVTNALAHRGFGYTVTMDLRDFFAHCTRDKLTPFVPSDLLDQIIVDGAARQGLPTSPCAANIAASPMDSEIDWWCRKRKVTYTRYADDLTFSFDDQAICEKLLADIPAIVQRHGFAVAPEKTHVFCAAGGRRQITGIAVDDQIHPTRAAKRRLRAARHQQKQRQAAGLAEWCSLKLPKAARSQGRRVVRREQSQGTCATVPTQPRRTLIRRTNGPTQ